MSAALQLTAALTPNLTPALAPELTPAWAGIAAGAERRSPRRLAPQAQPELQADEPPVSLAFYRRHTESILRRYLYASMQVGRAPSILSDPVGRGWASSRPIRTFEDAVIFVLDVERCLERLDSLDRQMLSRIVLQEYTQAEASVILGMSTRAISYKFPQALDRLTEHLLASGLLVLPG
jgi:DNA-directed RNA polymerase specialized sigma24 family protein